MPDMKVETIATILINEFICRFGIMLQLVTDQGRQFESALFQELCNRLDIIKLRYTAFHPETNGLTERLNKTIEDMLSKYISHHQRDWDQWLPVLLLAHRTSIHDSTNQSPYQMMFGHDPTLPADLLYGHDLNGEDNLSPDKYVSKLQERLRVCHNNARKEMLKAAKRQKNAYDKRVHTIKYKPGDKVWVKLMNRIKGQSPKLSHRWEGPFIVDKVLSNLVVKVKNAKKYINVHHNRLKPYL
jgi:ribosomal protein L21E